MEQIRKKGKSVQSAQAMDGNLIDGIPLCGKILFAIKNGGLWRSWERVSMALRRSWVRVPLGPLDLSKQSASELAVFVIKKSQDRSSRLSCQRDE